MQVIWEVTADLYLGEKISENYIDFNVNKLILLPFVEFQFEVITNETNVYT